MVTSIGHHNDLVPMIPGLSTVFSHPLQLGKPLLRKKGTTAAFFQAALKVLSFQVQLQASSTVRTLKHVQIPMMPELSFQQENKRLAWRMARHDTYIPRWAGALWKDKGQVLGVWWQVCDMLHIPQMTRLKSHVMKLYSMKSGWDKHLEIGLLLTARRGVPDASSWPSPWR